ncbi:hypothetical protein [Brucella rhizosphaerae]|uniref:hypothetical protein n=1 Tax=Brucella rhizosphaerae TaxID=571254 RepID=UPI000B9875DC|nr:hypothetical protein [Brucella rhizosphaerae]
MQTYDVGENGELNTCGARAGFTFDRNIIDWLDTNANLDDRILLSLESPSARTIVIVLSEVISKGVWGHPAQRDVFAYDKLTSTLKSYSRIWKERMGLVADVADKLVPADAIGAHYDDLLHAFLEKVGRCAQIFRSRSFLEA